MMRLIQMSMACVAVLFAAPGQVRAGILSLGDDTFAAVSLDFAFPFFGTSYNQMFVGSNGFITFGSGDTTIVESVSEFLNKQPRIAGFWDDLNPGAGGIVDATGDANSMVVSFTGVPEFFNTGANTFSVTLFSNGNIDLTFGSMTSNDGIVGVSPGGGAVDPGPTDFSVRPGPHVMLGAVYEQFSPGFDLSGQTISFTAVPEPCSLVLFGIGASVAGVGTACRRRREKRQEVTV